MQQLILELAPAPAPTLGNFFPGRNAAALAVLGETLAGRERFVYLWGEAGSGTTHLLLGWVDALKQCGLEAHYLCAPQFDCPAGTAAAAVDDIERLDIVSQLALFDLYNAMRQSGGRLVAAGHRPPADLPLREDLRTRIGSGIVLQVQPLTEPEKRAALAQQAAGRGLRIGEDMLDFVLSRYPRDMGTQMAVIDALDRLSLETRRPPTLALLRAAMKNAT